jgi:hypothetical protein
LKTIVLVVMHKSYRAPADPVYLPIHAGCQGKKRICPCGDNKGENISTKNKSYCELTALYWAWKNIDFDALGLVHYRRYFVKRRFPYFHSAKPLSEEDFNRLLEKADVILPKPRHYVIETSWSHYAHAHHEQDLIEARKAIQKLCPEYAPTFDRVMRKRVAHRFNMFVMKRAQLNDYCAWIFGILSEVESKLDVSTYVNIDARVFGLIAERLLDVWIAHNHVKTAEVPVILIEKQNWVKKGISFILRKINAPAHEKQTHTEIIQH